jgi:hypothetical protein
MTDTVNPETAKDPTVEELMATVTRLGNDQLVAQLRYSLEYDGIEPTADYCKAAFVGIAYTMDIAERAYDANTLSATEMIACQSVASLSMQVWATLHDILTGDIVL